MISIQPPAGLRALEERLSKDLELLALPPNAWIPATQFEGETLLDVVVVGAGQAGIAAAIGLAHQGIRAVVIDRAPEGQEGPWATTARMETLRSPKELVGPAMGLPALTFRAWYEAQFGDEAWVRLDKIPRLQWMEYLRWIRRVMRLEVRNDTAVTAIIPRPEGFVVLKVATPAGEAVLRARRVVIAAGRDGLGGPSLPGFLRGVPREFWAHSSDGNEYELLRGKKVGVVGAGSSAMDSAATALECGAQSVDLLIRRADLPRVNKSKGAGVPGLTQGHFHLPDSAKWRLRQYINSAQVPPPRASTQRVSRFPNARFHLACAVMEVRLQDGHLVVQTAKGTFEFDFLIVSTGFQIDWTRRVEFSHIADSIRVWSEHFDAPIGYQDQELADSPVLGPAFEFQEKVAGKCPELSRVHCFCYPATLSHGALAGDIPNISDGARRLSEGIASHFYCEDFEQHFGNLVAYNEPELLGDEWTPFDSAFEPA